jgi:hypothetical protein
MHRRSGSKVEERRVRRRTTPRSERGPRPLPQGTCAVPSRSTSYPSTRGPRPTSSRTPRRAPRRAAHRASHRASHRALPGRTLARPLLTLLAVVAAVLLPVSPAAAAPAGPPVLPADLGIEALSPYQAQTACEPTARPGVIAFRQLVLAAYPGTADSGIVRGCTVGGASEHKEGRAWDWRVSASDPVHVEQVADLMDWLLAPDELGNTAAMARRLGVMYVIWDSRIWKSYQAARGWQPYSGASPHTDHVHVSFSWAGALGATSYWTGQVAPVMTRPVPPPTTTSATATATVTATISTTPVVDRRAVLERRRTAVQSLPGPWKRH